MLISSATRLQGIFFWDLLTYLIEATVFLLTGLQARTMIDRIGNLPLRELVLSAMVISGVVIVTRFLWVFPVTYLPRWLFPSFARRDPAPGWQGPFVIAFVGIRGIVSLAAALAIPFATGTGAPFPPRDLILFLTFSVIVVTLVGQGLLLPTVIRALRVADLGRAERDADHTDELTVRRWTIESALQRLDEIAAEGKVPSAVVDLLRGHQRERLQHLEYRRGDGPAAALARVADEVELQLIAAERAQLYRMLCTGEVKDETRRHIEHELDLREAQLLRAVRRDSDDA
jgi:CPA1 family monovalent cation:H+ antiporter